MTGDVVGRLRVGQLRATTLRADSLPRWAFALPFVSYPACWLLGIGDMIWIVAAGFMLLLLIRARDVRAPKGFGVWLLFLVWSSASVIQLDTGGRLVGFAYRQALYVAATVIALYAYNARRTIGDRYVCGVLTFFLGVMTAGALLAVAMPTLTVRTPLSWIVPGGLQANEVIGEMVVRRTTQWTENPWIELDPRPSAPFLYTNTWGNVYSLVLPFAVVYLAFMWRTRWRWPLVALLCLSFVAACLTLNRGMFIGLGVVLLFVGVQALRAGRVVQVLAGGILAAGAMLAWFLSPAGARLENRVSQTSSTEDRASLYIETWNRVLESPLFGYGAPRPSELPWLPSVGTQGQLWTVLFSHGFVGILLFLGWFVVVLVRAWNRLDMLRIVATGVVAATLVETLYYGMMTGVNVSLIAAVLALRASTRDEDLPEVRPRGAPGTRLPLNRPSTVSA